MKSLRLTLMMGFASVFAMTGWLPRVDAAEATPIPETLGWVSGHHVPAEGSAQGHVYLIEDAHFNLEAHQNIAALIEYLSDKAAVRTVLVEGAKKNIDGGYVQKFASRKTILALADDLLSQGKITGDVYADMVSPHDLQLHSIDDPDLYKTNVNAFIEVLEVRKSIGPVLAQALTQCKALEQEVFSETLQIYENKRRRFDQKALSFTEYSTYLFSLWIEQGGAPQDYPQIAASVALDQETIDSTRVAAEQRQAIEVLALSEDPEPLEKVTAVAQAIKQGQKTKQDFYAALDAALDVTQADRANYPELQKYLESLRKKNHLNIPALLNEIHALQHTQRLMLADSDLEYALLKAVEALEAYQNLLQLKWSANLYALYSENAQSWRFEQWVPELQTQLQSKGLDWDFEGNISEVDAQLQRAVRFYVLADQRNHAMVQNTINQLNQKSSHSAAMVVGGFHSSLLAKLLAEKGYEMTLITPRVGDTPMHDSYEEAMHAQFLSHLKQQPTGND